MKAKKLVLTWFEPRKCWRKVYRGKTYYFAKGQCSGKTDAEGYKLAVAEWERKKVEIDNNAPPAPNMTALDGAIGRIVLTAMATGQDIAGAVRSFLAHNNALGDNLPDAQPTPEKETSLLVLATRYFETRRAKTMAGNTVLATYGAHRHNLNVFLNFCAGRNIEHIGQVTAQVLSTYWAGIEKQIGNGLAPRTAKKRMDYVKRFLKWCYANEYIDSLPRNLSILGEVEIPAPKPESFTVEEVRKLFDAAYPRLKAYILLGLNCGYTQIDVASLTDDMVDWENGVITRTRHKTGQPQRHKLWKVTLELLKQERSRKPGLLFYTRQNRPAVEYLETKKGSVSKNDSIVQAFGKLMRKLGVNGNRSYKSLRKTGAQAIQDEYPDTKLPSMYLSHGEKGMIRHYTTEELKRLDSPIEWMEAHFNLSLNSPVTAS